MTAPRSFRLRNLALVGTTAAVLAALVVTTGPATLAAADRLITGKDIANHSIGSKDLAANAVQSKTIRKNAVTGSHILDGSISAADLDAGLQGVVGPTGPTGPTGPAGAAGPAGTDGKDGKDGAPGPSGQAKPDGVATWTIHHEQNGESTITQTSTDKVPAGALIEPLAYTLDGDFSGCDGMMFGNAWSFSLQNSSPLLSTYSMSVPPNATIVQTVSPQPVSLVFTASCTTGTGFPPNPAPLPPFDASLTFQWTVRDTTPTRAFN